MSDTVLNAFLARGTAAQRTSFTPTPPVVATGPDSGYFWYETDTGKTYAWNGSAWVQSGGGGLGTVTHTGALVANEIVLGNGTDDVKPLGALGTTVTVLHGNAGGAPSFAAVNLAADVTGTLPTANLPANGLIAALAFLIDGNGSAIATGVKGYLQIPFACTITGWTILSVDGAGPATSGSIVIDVWKGTIANYVAGTPPVVGGTLIPSGTKPTLSTAKASVSSSLTGWTTAIAAGDCLGFNVDSVTTVTRILIELQVTKT